MDQMYQVAMSFFASRRFRLEMVERVVFGTGMGWTDRGEWGKRGQDSERRRCRTAVSPYLGAGEKSQQRDQAEADGSSFLPFIFFLLVAVVVVWVRVHLLDLYLFCSFFLVVVDAFALPSATRHDATSSAPLDVEAFDVSLLLTKTFETVSQDKKGEN